MAPLILASTSKYRKELMDRLAIAYQAKAPLFDEESAKNQSLDPRALCLMLGKEKALSLADTTNCVIGSDQMVVIDQQILGKPKTVENAVAQILELQGKVHELLTSTTIFFKKLQEIHFLNVTRMHMRQLSVAQARRYVELDLPIDCAGSYKIERHGISLFEKIECEDFSAIQGLPLLRLTQELSKLGYRIPGP